MDISLYVIFILLPLLWSRGQAASCGSVTTSQTPPREGDYIDIVYHPSNGASTNTRQWWRRNSNGRNVMDIPVYNFLKTPPSTDDRLKETSRHDGRGGFLYSLRIFPIELSDEGTYFVQCSDSDFSNGVILEVTTKEFISTTCGQLSVIQNNQTVGSTFQLLFTAETRFTFAWQHEIENTYDTINIFSSRFEVTSSNYQFVLKISNTVYNDRGKYRVNCGAEQYSNTVELLLVVDPPSKPEFLNSKMFVNCDNCIAAIPGINMDVTCVVNSGSRPMYMDVYQNAFKLASFTLTGPSLAKGTVSFLPSVSDENTFFRCTIRNDATEAPLETSSNLYIFRKPDKLVIQTPPAIIENSQVHIKCMSTGGRPAPKLKFEYDGIFYEDFPNVTSVVPSDNTFRVESTFMTKVSRADNGKMFMCVSEHDASPGKLDYSDEISFDVFFPPLTVNVAKQSMETTASGESELTIQCTVGQSNPKSIIEWKGVKNVPRTPSERLYDHKDSYGGWTLTQELKLNLTRDDNKRDIICAVKNTEFPDLDLIGQYKVNITYQPVIEIAQGSTITAYEGDDVTIPCKVTSNPSSSISWYNETGHIITAETKKTNTISMHFGRISFTNAGVYTCSANNGIGVRRNQTIQLQVKSLSEKPTRDTLTDTGSSSGGTIAAVICSILLVALVAVVVVLIIRKRRSQTSGVKNQGSVRIHVEDRKPSVHPTIDEPVYNNIANMNRESNGELDTPVEYAVAIPKALRESRQPSEGAHQPDKHKSTEVSRRTEYTNAIEKPKRQMHLDKEIAANQDEPSGSVHEPVEYSTVIPKAQRQSKQASCGESLHITNKGQKQGGNTDTNDLVYIELDLDALESKKKPSLIKQESQTEYVSIDFTKKGAEYTAD